MNELWLIGIGTGSLSHLTLEGQKAIQDAAVILVPHKGSDKGDLAELRYDLIRQVQSSAKVIPFKYPVRDPALPYAERVDAWHDDIAAGWVAAVPNDVDGPVALLVWGDPSLYDSTLRIAERLSPKPRVRVVPGITAIQALTSAHAIPVNTINGAYTVTTGRQLRDNGWPEGVDRLIVMLDGEASFTQLDLPDAHIWWGAFLGSDMQSLRQGRLGDVASDIAAHREKLRDTHGWIMDTYLIQR